MRDPKSILKQFWGYDEFRPLQLDIIESVLSGTDTLAILPTGGGKSICFQVPALLLDGVCVVVTPLIALMQDQVHQLRRRGIEAEAIFSGMSLKAVANAIDSCAYGKAKFLYVSPERLKTDLFLQRSKGLKISLLAIDEAHCISQWGYDFRPPYLEITNYRSHIQAHTCIALTASATEVVRKDIAEKLGYSQYKLFVKSFARANLSYSVVYETTKNQRLSSLLEKVPGAAIVYLRSRERTVLISKYLQSKGIAADFYHAGLSVEQRTQKQKDWISGKIRVIVATNAFGMGIDKPDVRLVVHLDLPESIEAYYQEAGRAGRDEKKAYAVLLYNQDDTTRLQENTQRACPEPKFLNTIYQKLSNFYKIAMGTGFMAEFNFDLDEFAQYAGSDKPKVHYALNRLQQIGLIKIDDPTGFSSKVQILANRLQLYEFEVSNKEFGQMLSFLLRNYEGILSRLSEIDEDMIAKKCSLSVSKVVQGLEFMEKSGIAIYQKRSQKQLITFLMPRSEPAIQGELKKKLDFLYQRANEQMTSVLNYAETTDKCRTQLILRYFDESTAQQCNVCDYCTKEKKMQQYSKVLGDIKLKIKNLIQAKPQTIQQMKLLFGINEQEIFEEAIRQLVEEGKVEFDSSGKMKVK